MLCSSSLHLKLHFSKKKKRNWKAYYFKRDKFLQHPGVLSSGFIYKVQIARTYAKITNKISLPSFWGKGLPKTGFKSATKQIRMKILEDIPLACRPPIQCHFTNNNNRYVTLKRNEMI